MHPKNVSLISINTDMEHGMITVDNNGPLGGISIRENVKEGIWNPELVFGHLLTSTNYDDTQKRVVGGRMGTVLNSQHLFHVVLCHHQRL